MISASILCAICVMGCYLFWRTWNMNPEAEISGIQVIPEEAHIGGVIHIEVLSKMPWYRRPQHNIYLEPPEGLQVIDNTAQKVIGLGWGQWTWKSVLELQAYDFGPFSEMIAKIAVSPNKVNKNEEFDVTLPEIVVAPQLDETMTDVHMASELPQEFLDQQKPPVPKWLVLSLAVIGITAALAFFVLRRRHKKAPEAPKPWVVAESLIFDLKGRLPLDAESVFVELTDIIRRYTERVYKLPATERTTPEFLNEIKRDGLQLSAEHRLLLTDFLTAADMVKFAKVDATQGQIDDAIKKATRFIVETSEPIIKRQMTHT